MIYSRLLLMAILSLPGNILGLNFKIGLIAPWNDELEFSGITSASAVSIAIDRVHADNNLNANGAISLR